MITNEKAAEPTDAAKAIPTSATSVVAKNPAPSATPSVTPTAPVVATKTARRAPRVAKPTDVVAKPLVPAKKLVKTAPKATDNSAAPVTTAAKAKPQPKAKAEKPAKKPKLVRDSFTIPKAEYSVIDDLKQRAGKLSSPVKKSELLRAGIKALAAMSDTAFLTALKLVPAIKTGRPTKG